MADGSRGVRNSPYYPQSVRDRLVARAHYIVLLAIKRGTLPEQETQSCVDCGAQAECYDHRNYHEPLKVVPVCKPCNTRRGPGFPYPTDDDGQVHKILLPDGASNAGMRWSSVDGGEGFMPAALPCHADIDWLDVEAEVDDGRDRVKNEMHLFHRNQSRRTHFRGNARADYFKARDPWGLGEVRTSAERR
jgi:hypothetical protein